MVGVREGAEAVCCGRDETCDADERGNNTQQRLDKKTLDRLETAVSKSSYIGTGKKLKVKNNVCSAWVQIYYVPRCPAC